MSDRTLWEKVFIWSGFVFKSSSGVYSFRYETLRNREYLGRILARTGYAQCFDGEIFIPDTKDVNRTEWLNAIEDLHGGSEGGMPDDLSIMDTYIAGIIRILNRQGFATAISCDGHGTLENYIELSDRKKSGLLDICLRLISDGKYGFCNNSVTQNEGTHGEGERGRKRSREYLLDIAELLHENEDRISAIRQEFMKH